MAKKIKKHPRVVLIQISGLLNDYWGFYPPLGLASIASYAMKYGQLLRKNILVLDNNLPNIVKIIRSFKPDIIGFSTFSNNYHNTVKVAKDLKKLIPKAIFILGGVHISIFPETLDSVFDFGVLREGEETFLEILKRWKKHGGDLGNLVDIKGIVFNDGKKIVVNSERELIVPLDKIPSIDWSLFPKVFFKREIVKDTETNVWRDHKVFPLFTSRGCPYHCVFCARTALWKAVRYFSEDRVGKDVETLRKKFGITAIQIWDDLFTVSVPRLKLIENQLEKRDLLDKILFYRVFARSDLFTHEMAIQLKKINVKSVAFGLESGSERILKYLKRDTIKVSDNYNAVELCEKEKIGFVAGMMMGIPTETEKDMDDTFEFIKYVYSKKSLEIIDMCRATPFPGTELYEYAIREKLLPKSFSELSDSLSLSNVENDTPLLIKDKSSVKSYQRHWRQVKNYEKKLWLRNRRQKGFDWSTRKIRYVEFVDRMLFFPSIIFERARRGDWDFFVNFVKLAFHSMLKRINYNA